MALPQLTGETYRKNMTRPRHTPRRPSLCTTWPWRCFCLPGQRDRASWYDGDVRVEPVRSPPGPRDRERPVRPSRATHVHRSATPGPATAAGVPVEASVLLLTWRDALNRSVSFVNLSTTSSYFIIESHGAEIDRVHGHT